MLNNLKVTGPHMWSTSSKYHFAKLINPKVYEAVAASHRENKRFEAKGEGYESLKLEV